VEELLLLEDKYLNLQVLVWFLICAIEKHWSKDLGSPAEKYAMISAIERAREEELLTVETLRTVFASIAVVHRQDILPSTNKDKHDLKGDFAGAVAGRNRGKGNGGRGGNSRYQPLRLAQVSDQPTKPSLKASANQQERGQPAQVQQPQPAQPAQREICRKYFQGKCDLQCGRRHVYPCNLHYIAGPKKCKNADKCKYSHEYTVKGLARHNELNPDHKQNYDLLKEQQIMEPISSSAIDCRICNGTHAPGKCRRQRHDRIPFSGHVDAEVQRSALRDVNRYASLQRTIENELAERHD
jgi:hypothetical protein